MSDDASLRGRTLAGEVLSGAGLGVLVGLLVGLSVAEIVGTVLAAVVALLAAFFGLQPRHAGAEEGGSEPRVWRIAAFGFFCAGAVVAGVTMRGGDVLGDSIAGRIEEWRQAGYPEAEARALVAYEKLGVAAADWQTVDAERVTRQRATALFGDGTAASCSGLAGRRFATVDDRLAAFRAAGDPWIGVAEAVSDLGETVQADVLEASWRLACE